MTNTYEELYHHGIKGMKWGVRRFQDKNGRLTSAGKKRYSRGESMDAEDPSDSEVTRQVKKDYNNLSDSEFKQKYQGDKNTYRKRVNRYGDPYMNAPLAKLGKKSSNNPPLTEEEIKARNKKILIGLAVGAGVAVAAGATYYAVKKKQSLKTLNKTSLDDGEKFVSFGIGGKNRDLFISDPSSLSTNDFERELSDQVRSTNKGGTMAALFLEDRNQNCQYCTTAYEMNRRGLNVQANRRKEGGPFEQVESWFENPEPTYVNDKFKQFVESNKGKKQTDLTYWDGSKQHMSSGDAQRLLSSLASQGEGARGNLQGIYAAYNPTNGIFNNSPKYTPAGGHSIAYEVHHGEVYLIDNQVGKWYKGADAQKQLCNFQNAMSYRTDNCNTKTSVNNVIQDKKHGLAQLKGESLNSEGKQALAAVGVIGAITVGTIMDGASYTTNSTTKNGAPSYDEDEDY